MSTRNDRTNFTNGSVAYSTITGEAATIEFHTDKGLYGFHLREWPKTNSLVVAGFTILSGAGAVPSPGKLVASYGSRTGWVWAHEDDVGAVSCDYEGGGWAAHEENLVETITSSAAFAAEVAAEVAATALSVNAVNGYLYGLTLSNNGSDATNDIDISAGAAIDTTNANILVLASGLTKRLDAAWAVGTNQGGLDTGAIANTTYHIWLIKRSDTNVVDVLFSASATSPTMPTNYDYKRRIGSIVRTGAAIKGFTQIGDKFEWKDPVSDISASNPGTSAVTRTLTLPTGIVVDALIRSTLVNAGTGGASDALLTSLISTDIAPSASNADIVDISNSAGTARRGSATLRVTTNASAQIRSRLSFSDASVTLIISTYGWIDRRGRDAA